MKTGAASSEKAFYEARLTAYDAQLTLHEAALRTIKRSLFMLMFFAKNVVEVFVSAPRPHKSRVKVTFQKIQLIAPSVCSIWG